jgi:hypothetical protein
MAVTGAPSCAGAPSTAASADVLFAPLVIAPAWRITNSPFTFDDLGSLTAVWVPSSETANRYVIRLQETDGAIGVARLQFAKRPASATLVDFLEREMGEARGAGNGEYKISYGPYQIVSASVREV